MRMTKGVAAAALLGLIAKLDGPARAASNPQIVTITASKYHFAPDRITLKKGAPVILRLTSSDATHGFMVRALGVDTDIKPGAVTDMRITPATAGTFKIICDHYCGIGHGGMKMTVVVE